MHIRRERKPSKTECVFFLTPGFSVRRQILPAPYEGTGGNFTKKRKEKRESHEAKCKREDVEYTSLAETVLVKVADGYVTFFHNFKYMGTWVSYYLSDDYYITKRLAAANIARGYLGRFWDDPHVDMYSK